MSSLQPDEQNTEQEKKKFTPMMARHQTMRANNEFFSGHQVLADTVDLGRRTSSGGRGVKYADPRAAATQRRSQLRMLYARAATRGIPKKEVDAAVRYGESLTSVGSDAKRDAFSYATDRYQFFADAAKLDAERLQDVSRSQKVVPLGVTGGTTGQRTANVNKTPTVSFDGTNFLVDGKVLDSKSLIKYDQDIRGFWGKDLTAPNLKKFKNIMTGANAEEINELLGAADLETTSSIIRVEDATNTNNVRYLLLRTVGYTDKNGKKRTKRFYGTVDPNLVHYVNGNYVLATDTSKTSADVASAEEALKDQGSNN